jgi:hypothetical protein
MKTPADAALSGAAGLTRSPFEPRRISATEVFTVSLVLVICLLVIYHVPLFSGFAITPGGGDSVLSNSTLEHEWHRVSGGAANRSNES